MPDTSKSKMNLGTVLANGAAGALADAGGSILSAGLGSLLSTLPGHTILGSLGRSMTGSGLTGAQIEANQFSHNEAELAYQRELEADSTKYQRMVGDATKAGLNPVFLAGSGAGSVHSPAASSVPPSVPNLFGALEMSMALKRLELDKKLTDANVEKIDAETRSIQARTEETELNVGFFRDTLELRKVLLGDEHERNEWERQIGLRGVKVKEDNLEMLKQNANHYNDFLDKQSEMIGQQVKSEPLKRAMYKANAREANQNADYKAAMAEVEKKYTEAKTEESKKEMELLAVEARVKHGIYDERYIADLGKALHAEAEAKELQIQLAKGDYSGVSKGLQKMFEGIEAAGKHKTLFGEVQQGETANESWRFHPVFGF